MRVIPIPVYSMDMPEPIRITILAFAIFVVCFLVTVYFVSEAQEFFRFLKAKSADDNPFIDDHTVSHGQGGIIHPVNDMPNPYEMKTKETNERDHYLFKVLDHLLCTASGFNVPIVYTNPDGLNFSSNTTVSTENAAGYLKYTTAMYSYIIDSIFIRARANEHVSVFGEESELYKFIGTLAHEVGHIVSMMNYGDDSEEGADLEAYKICKEVLEPDEKENTLIASWLALHFPDKDNYIHPLKILTPDDPMYVDLGKKAVELARRMEEERNK